MISMQRAYQATGLLLLALAVFLGIRAAGLPYYSSLGPGPGFFPLWLCGLLGLFAVAMIVQATFGTPEDAPADVLPDRAGWLRIGAAVAALAATAGLVAVLGFRITTFLFYLVLLPALGSRNPVLIVVLAAIGSFGVHWLFSGMLGLALPAGVLGW